MPRSVRFRSSSLKPIAFSIDRRGAVAPTQENAALFLLVVAHRALPQAAVLTALAQRGGPASLEPQERTRAWLTANRKSGGPLSRPRRIPP